MTSFKQEKLNWQMRSVIYFAGARRVAAVAAGCGTRRRGREKGPSSPLSRRPTKRQEKSDLFVYWINPLHAPFDLCIGISWGGRRICALFRIGRMEFCRYNSANARLISVAPFSCLHVMLFDLRRRPLLHRKLEAMQERKAGKGEEGK